MRILLLYLSPNGTTRGVTRSMQQQLQTYGHDVRLLDIGEPGNRDCTQTDMSIFDGIDLIGIGSPVYHLRLLEPMSHFLHAVLPRIAVNCPLCNIFVYVTYSGITTGKVFLQTAKLLERYQIGLVGAIKLKAPHFLDTQGYPDAQTKNAIGYFVGRMSKKQFQAIPQNAIKSILPKPKRIIRVIYPFSKMIAFLRQQAITITAGHCIGCGKCVKECPVDAIKLKDFAIRNNDVCLHCYHCVCVCPVGAIDADVEKVYRMIDRNRRIVGSEIPQNDAYL